MPDDVFSRPPSGTEVDGAGMKALVQGKEKPSPTIEEVANVLGGSVNKVIDEPVEVVKVTPPIVEGVEVSMEDRKEYLRTLLAGEAFKKKYVLYNGNIEVEFRTRTVKENDNIYIQLNHPDMQARINARSKAIIRERLRMITCIDKLSVGGAMYKLPLSLEIFDEMNEVVFSAIRKSMRHFEDTCDVLFEKANDSNFWNKTAGAI